MEEMYGPEGFAQLWSDWIDGFQNTAKVQNGNICKNDLVQIRAKTLIVHGAKDPMIAAEHVPYLLKHIKQTELSQNIEI